jgi:hypothetical protein
MNLPSPASSLRQSIEERFGSKTVRPGIVKPQLVTHDKSLSRLIGSYLDERRKSTSRLPDDITGPDYAQRIVAGAVPQRPGIDYVASRGGIRVSGFLRQVLLKAVGSDEQNLTDEQVVAFLKRWWARERARHKKKAYHLIFSIDPRQAAALAEKGISVDNVLHACVAEAMLVYNNRYYPDASLGWITGIHHDRHHTHAHVLLFPETSKGRGLNVSRNAPVSLPTYPPKQIRVDFLHTLVAGYLNAVTRQLGLVAPGAAERSDGFHQRMAALGAAGEMAREELAAAGQPALTKEIVRRTGEFFKTADALAKINQYVPKLVEIERRGGPKTAKGLTAQEDLLKTLLAEHQVDAGLIAAAREKADRLFQQWREHPDRYRMIQYAKDTPPVSPSGTYSYLKGLVRNREPSWPEIQQAVNGRFARLDALMARQTSQMPAEPVIGQAFSERRFLRAGVAFYIGRQLLLGWYRKRGLPPPSLGQPPLTALPNFLPEDAHQAFLARLNAIARRIGADHHTASMQELIALYQRARMLLSVGQDPNEEPVPLILPEAPALVPSAANFLEREAHHKGIRSLKDIQAEQEELLRRVSQVLLVDNPMALPRLW